MMKNLILVLAIAIFTIACSSAAIKKEAIEVQTQTATTTTYAEPPTIPAFVRPEEHKIYLSLSTTVTDLLNIQLQPLTPAQEREKNIFLKSGARKNYPPPWSKAKNKPWFLHAAFEPLGHPRYICSNIEFYKIEHNPWYDAVLLRCIIITWTYSREHWLGRINKKPWGSEVAQKLILPHLRPRGIMRIFSIGHMNSFDWAEQALRESIKDVEVQFIERVWSAFDTFSHFEWADEALKKAISRDPHNFLYWFDFYKRETTERPNGMYADDFAALKPYQAFAKKERKKHFKKLQGQGETTYQTDESLRNGVIGQFAEAFESNHIGIGGWGFTSHSLFSLFKGISGNSTMYYFVRRIAEDPKELWRLYQKFRRLTIKTIKKVATKVKIKEILVWLKWTKRYLGYALNNPNSTKGVYAPLYQNIQREEEYEVHRKYAKSLKRGDLIRSADYSKMAQVDNSRVDFAQWLERRRHNGGEALYQTYLRIVNDLIRELK